MHRLYSCFAVIIVTLLQFTAVVSAGPLDDYYLQQFGETKSVQLEKALLSVVPETPARCGMPLKHSLHRDWSLLEQTTQKVLAKQLALPAYDSTVTSSGGHFKIYYFASGTEAPKVSQINTWPGLSSIASTADWARQVAETFEQVYSTYVSSSFNYRLVPLPLNNTSGTYDIYLQELSVDRYYGYTTQPVLSNNTVDPNYAVGQPFSNSFSSYIVIDNDFAESIFTNSVGGPYSPLQSLQITAAHEYHHAIQFGYNYYFDIWYAEATSTWMEDELYDSVNQLYDYIPEWFTQSKLSLDIAESITTGGGYGRWIFNRYLAEKHGTDMIRSVWEKVGGLNSPNGNDIPMVPVLDSLLSATYGSSISSDFFGFARRVYYRTWTSHTSETGKIPDYSAVATYSTYPVSTNTVTLPHYSFAYYTFVPSSSASVDLNITVTGTSGIKATAFIKSGGVITEYPFATVTGTTVTVPGFSSSSEVVLLIANTTDTDSHTANFSTNGTSVPVTEPAGGTVYTPTVPVMPTITGTVSSQSSKNCFIATAAYGSYLHPQVQLLRNFRDEYLLTNAPGRALVASYYQLSPPVADFIARHPFLRSVTRLILTPIISAVVHPAAAGTTLLLAMLILYRPLRRRVLKLVAVG